MNKQNQNKKTTWVIQLAVIIVLVGILVIFNGNTKVKGTDGGCCATSNYKVTLSFTSQYSLTISAGTGGTTDPAAGIYTYNSGASVSVKATPNSGYEFSGWSGDASGTTNPITITMDSDKSIIANFIRQYKLTISSGTGGTTDPAPGTYTYDSGASVSVKANPSSGYQFSGWSGDASGTTNPISITVNADKSITASFGLGNQAPTVSCNDAEQWIHCTGRDRNPTLLWTYSDPESNPQSAYEIQVDDSSSFSSPEEDTGWVSSAGTEYATRGNFSWDTSYYWHIKVKDSKDVESSWSSSCSFKTPLHAYPSADLSKSPSVPVAGEPVQFVDASTYYGGSYGTAWSWSFQGGTPATSTQVNPKVTFSTLGTKTVGLTVTDSSGYSCSCSESVGIGLPIPKWKEIIPW